MMRDDRPLRGGRGLKLSEIYRIFEMYASPPSRGARIETASSLRQSNMPEIAPFAGGAD